MKSSYKQESLHRVYTRFPMSVRTYLVPWPGPAKDYLLVSLVDTDIDATKLWFDVRKDSKHLVQDLFTWREKTQRPEIHTRV